MRVPHAYEPLPKTGDGCETYTPDQVRAIIDQRDVQWLRLNVRPMLSDDEYHELYEDARKAWDVVRTGSAYESKVFIAKTIIMMAKDRQ